MKIECDAYKGTGIYSLYLKLDQDIPSVEFLEKVKDVLNDLDIYEPYGEKFSYIKHDDFDLPLVSNIIIRLTEEELVRLRLMHDLIIIRRSRSFDLD